MLVDVPVFLLCFPRFFIPTALILPLDSIHTIVPTFPLPLVLGNGIYPWIVRVTVLVGIASIHGAREAFANLRIACHLGLRNARNEFAQRRRKVVRGDDDGDFLCRRHLCEVVLRREGRRPLSGRWI